MRVELSCTIGLILAAAVGAMPLEERTRLYSKATPPPREALDRLNLKLAWNAYVPMDGRRDGLFSVQLHDRHLLVQTRSGLVSLIEADTGRALWRTRVGHPYLHIRPAAINYHNVLVINGTFLFCLDRETGTTQWQMTLPGGLSTAPVIDEEFAYLCGVDKRLYAFRLPLIRQGELYTDRPVTAPQTDPSARIVLPQDLAAKKASSSLTYFTSVRQAGSSLNTGPEPLRVWSSSTHVHLEFPPLYTKTSVFVAAPEATYFAYDKTPDSKYFGTEIYREQTAGAIAVPPGVYEDTVYLGCRDSNVYAVHMDTGRVGWRYTAGSPVSRSPAATDQDLYVTSEREGMVRLNRDTGDPVWRVSRANQVGQSNLEADQFMAANQKFVYALDKSGRFLVLDRQRGAVLSRYDLRDFAFSIPNETTDRIYLGANNGLIICLHDKENREPVRHRSGEERGRNPTFVLRDALNRRVNEKEGEQRRTVRDVLRELSKRFDVQIIVSEAAFREAKVESVSSLEVLTPRAENLPLREYLKLILNMVKARFEVLGDTIQVLPVKQDAPPMAPGAQEGP